MQANYFFYATLVMLYTGCKAQPVYGTKYLQQEKQIPLQNVHGRIDHMDVNLQDKIVYVAALGNNTVEVVDIAGGKVIHSITGLDEPQGVGYIPKTKELFIANGGNGDCYFYNAGTFEKTATLHLSSDADDVRYDSATQKIYVGYGDGGIAEIDAISHTLLSDIKLPGHPEGFQLDKGLNIIYVNIPGKNMVGVVNIGQRQLVNSWKRDRPAANFPMAISSKDHTVFIGYRHPAKLVVLNGQTGKETGQYNMVCDADDVYYDEQAGLVYISGGEGFINVFSNENGSFKQVANIAGKSGARTSLLIPSMHTFILAERATGGNPAQLTIYRTL